MEKEIKDMLQQVLANQVSIYKRLEEIEYKIKGGLRSAQMSTYVDELYKKSEEALIYIKHKK